MDLVPQPFDWLPFGSGEKGQPHHGFGVSSVRVNIFQWLPCGWNHVCWKSVIELSFLRWCNGVMDSVRGFCLLGQSVPLVQILARTLALGGFFPFIFFWLPSSFGYIYVYTQNCRQNCFGLVPVAQLAEHQPRLLAGVPGSIPGWGVLAFFPSCWTSSFKIFLSV